VQVVGGSDWVEAGWALYKLCLFFVGVDALISNIVVSRGGGCGVLRFELIESDNPNYHFGQARLSQV
jgi:hypothetical protein